MKEPTLNELITACYFSSFKPVFSTDTEEIRLFLNSIMDYFPAYIDFEEVFILLNSLDNKDDDIWLEIIRKAEYLARGKKELLCGSEDTVESIVTKVHIKGDSDSHSEKLGFFKKSDYNWFFKTDTESKFDRDSFKTAFFGLKNANEKQYSVSLDAIVEEYLSNVWCGIYGLEDVGMWQYSKLKVAFAIALYGCVKKGISISDDSQLFRLVSGDASGIQKYIFNLKSNSGAAKLLRARSFQIWIQSLMVASLVAEKFNVSLLSIISFSGGRFLMLLPNIPESDTYLNALRKEIDEYFIKHFYGILSIILSDGVIFSVNDLLINGSKLQQEIVKDINVFKNKKLQSGLNSGCKLEDLYSEIQKKGGVCDYCGENAAEEFVIEDKKVRKCSQCGSLMEVGRKLSRVFDGKNHNVVLRNDTLDISENLIDSTNDKGVTFSVDSFRSGVGRLFVPYTVPIDKGDVITFEELALQAEGNKKLAMFKADVDYLGLVFGNSLGKNWSLARFSELSMRMHAFFSDGLRKIIQSQFENIYVVFSGGDDVCVIGPWSDIIRFSEYFHDEFSRFTNANPSLTLSAGISLFADKTPVAVVVDWAEEALEQSKNREENDCVVKNGITVFNRTVSWEEYSNQIQIAKKELEPITTGKNTLRGLVYSLLDYSDRSFRMKKMTNLSRTDLLWQSHFKYRIARNRESLKEKRRFFSELVSEPEKMENVRIAASIVVNQNRDKEEDFYESIVL